MKINISGKNIAVSDYLRRVVNKKKRGNWNVILSPKPKCR